MLGHSLPPRWLATRLLGVREEVRSATTHDRVHDFATTSADGGRVSAHRLTWRVRRTASQRSATRILVAGMAMHLDQNVGFAVKWVGTATNRAAFCPEQISQLTVLREYQCTRWQMTFFMPLSASGELPPRVFQATENGYSEPHRSVLS